MGCSRGDDCRFVPPDPPHSALALLAMAGGECEWRWVAPGVSSRRKPDRGAQISVAIEWMRFEGGGTLPPRFFPLPNGQDIVRAFSEGPPRERCYGFSCITVTTVMQENLLCEPHAVRCRVSCIMGAPNHNARNSIGGWARGVKVRAGIELSSPGSGRGLPKISGWGRKGDGLCGCSRRPMPGAWRLR